MNDTHGAAGEGWYGFDLDGTLAVYDKWQGIDHIGKPVRPMVDLIRKLHDEGKTVKIVTARVAPRPKAECRPNPHCTGGASSPLPDYANGTVMRNPPSRGEAPRSVLGAFYSMSDWTATNFITDWCLKNLGFLPEITHEKDHLMLELYDDRVKQVVPNMGILVDDLLHVAETRNNAYKWTNSRLLDKIDELEDKMRKKVRHDTYDNLAMVVGKVFIVVSVTWALAAGIPLVVSKLF